MNKLCSPLALFEVSVAGGCAEGGSAGGGMATSAGDTSVGFEHLLVYPFVNGWSHSGNSASTRRSRSTTARVCFRHPELWSDVQVLARRGQRRKSGCQFHMRLFSHS